MGRSYCFERHTSDFSVPPPVGVCAEDTDVWKIFLLWSLDGKRPLSSNRVNSLTKECLSEFGVDTSHWKAHSTRGAGVLWWKQAGLSQEEIQQLGQWKNSAAFQAHYLRLGVVGRAKDVMGRVHSTSPGLSAESDWSRTPGRHDPGGSDREDEAQRQGEPNPNPPRKRKAESQNIQHKKVFRPPGPPRFQFAKVSEHPPTPAPSQ